MSLIRGHLGFDPGSATGGFCLLAASGRTARTKIPIYCWGHYRKSKRKSGTIFLLDVYVDGKMTRHECANLWQVLVMIRKTVESHVSVWTLCVEGLFIGEDKDKSTMVSLCESAGMAVGVLTLDGDPARAAAVTWRSACGLPTGKVRGERAAKIAVHRRFNGTEGVTIIHACEAAFIALYGRLYEEAYSGGSQG